MKKIIFPFLFLIFCLVPFQGSAQTRDQDFNLALTYSSVKQQNRLSSLFYLLAVNNNQNLYKIHLNLSFNLRFSITTPTNKPWFLDYTVSGEKMSGDVLFRGFNIDSLLIPQKAEVELLVYQNYHLVDTIKSVISLHQGKILLPISEKAPVSPVFVKIKIDHVIFTKENYRHFVQMAGLINHYYGYREIIKQLDKFVSHTGEHAPASSVFCNYALLARLVNDINWHNFPSKLNLARSDTLKFEKAFADVLRRKIRMKTLTQQIFNENTTPNPADEEKFIKDFVALSTRAIALANGYQPYKANSFNEFAQIYSHNDVADFIRKVQKYYDRHNKTGQATTIYRGIYKGFVMAASLKIKQQSFVRALDLLANAAYFENNFPDVKRTAFFDSCLVQARDGLSMAYLKVALMASERNESLLAGRYIKKASTSLHAFDNIIRSPAKPVCYSQSAREMVKMAGTSLKQGLFHRAFSLLKIAHEACPPFSGSDTIYQKTCEKISESSSRISQKLFNKGLAVVMPEFIRLQQQYQLEDLHQFGLPFTGLYQFIQSQHSQVLIMNAVHYFIRKKDFASALLYLQLSKDPAKAKAEQKQIALGFAHSGLTPGNHIMGNASFGYFTKIYLRAKKEI